MIRRTWIPAVALVCMLTAMVLLQSGSASRAADAAAAGPIYAQLSSGMTQDPKGPTPLLVEMNSNDALGGLDHDLKAKTTDIIVKTAGVYFVVAAVQVGKESGDAGDYMDVWVKQNGKDVDNSGCRQVIHDPKFTTVMVCQGIAECKVGDVLQVAIAASTAGKGIGIKAIKPQGEPVIPSIIFSMYKIN